MAERRPEATKAGVRPRVESARSPSLDAIGIGDKLPLCVEMTDRAIVGRGVLLITVSRLPPQGPTQARRNDARTREARARRGHSGW